MYPDSDSETTLFADNADHRRSEAGVQDHHPGHRGASGHLLPGEGDSGTPERAARGTTGRDLLGWGLTLLVVAVWCTSALGIGVNFARSLWEWLPIFVFGGGVPAVVLWQANRILAPRQANRPVPSAKHKERELLEALAKARGELTPITAALLTSLTAEEAAQILEQLATKGHLQLRVEDAIQSYALRQPDRRALTGLPQTAAAAGLVDAQAPLPLEEPLSERELEVLMLLASGRTNREIASDLFISVGTIKTHTSNIYGKLGVRNRAEALARARGAGLIK